MHSQKRETPILIRRIGADSIQASLQRERGLGVEGRDSGKWLSKGRPREEFESTHVVTLMGGLWPRTPRRGREGRSEESSLHGGRFFEAAELER